MILTLARDVKHLDCLTQLGITKSLEGEKYLVIITSTKYHTNNIIRFIGIQF